jgi:thioredoxin-like negative regulator of GroEL
MCESVYAQVTVYSVDVNSAEDLALEHGVSKLPRLLFFRSAKKVGDYLGSDEAEITQLFEKHIM